MTKSNDSSSGNFGRRKSLIAGVFTIVVVCLAVGTVYWVWAGKREADERVRQLDQARLESEKLIASVEEAKRRNIELQRRLKAEEDARQNSERVRIEVENARTAENARATEDARAAEDARVAAEAQPQIEAKPRAAVLARASEKEARRARDREVQRRLKAKEDARYEAERARMEAENARAAEDARVAKEKENARLEAERVRMEAEARAAEDARVAAEAQAKTEAASRAAVSSRASQEEARRGRERGTREFATLGPAIPLEPQKSAGLPYSDASPDRIPVSPRRQRRTAQQLCANSGNSVTRAICQAHWCATPEHSEEAFCRQGRVAQAGAPRRDAGY